MAKGMIRRCGRPAPTTAAKANPHEARFKDASVISSQILRDAIVKLTGGKIALPLLVYGILKATWLHHAFEPMSYSAPAGEVLAGGVRPRVWTHLFAVRSRFVEQGIGTP